MVDVDAARPGGALPGRRERKKAETRAAIARAALELFLERGFDQVTLREVASRADVALATVFAHFSGKEALVVDEEDDVAAALAAAVRDRAADVDALDAVEAWFRRARALRAEGPGAEDYTRYRALVTGTPALHAHWQTSWRRHRGELADALAESAGMTPIRAGVVAAMVVEAFLHAADSDDPADVLDEAFGVLRDGVPGGGVRG